MPCGLRSCLGFAHLAHYDDGKMISEREDDSVVQNAGEYLMSHLSIYVPAVVPAARRLTAVTTALALVSGTWGYMPARAQVEQPQPAVQAAPQLSPAQIDQLVAPIALYPDNLLGQVLSASTYPLEIVMAARWSDANPRVTGEGLEAAMQAQSWDPSIK